MYASPEAYSYLFLFCCEAAKGPGRDKRIEMAGAGTDIA